jgi:endo-1,4-beta-mannosidase
LRIITDNLSQDIWCLSQNSKEAPPEYKSGALPLELTFRILSQHSTKRLRKITKKIMEFPFSVLQFKEFPHQTFISMISGQ